MITFILLSLPVLLVFLPTTSSYSPDLIFGRCSSESCKNGGDCHQVEKLRFICQCDEDHYGFQCEHERSDSCLQDDSCPPSKDVCGRNRPCVNGFCKNTEPGYACWCPVGYNGQHCEVEDPHQICRPDYCSHGHCIVDDGHRPKCVCDEEWTGTHCDDEAESTSECIVSPCAPMSLCLNTSGSIECVCAMGRTGPRCEFELNLCTNDKDCLNGGYCLNERCICREGFEGTSCEQEKSDPCMGRDNMRNCPVYQDCVANRTEILGFSCVCPPGFEGAFCDTLIHGQTEREENTTMLDYSNCYLRACPKLAGNGICDEECNHAGCRFDGGDCSLKQGRNCLFDDFEGSGGQPETNCTMTTIKLKIRMKPGSFVRKVDDFLTSITQRLRTWARIRKTEGELDVFEVDSGGRQGPRVRFGSRTDARVEYSSRARREAKQWNEYSGLIVVVQVGLAECSNKCFRLVNSVAHSMSDAEWREERWRETRLPSVIQNSA